jgi:hypothetical protein
MRQGLLNTRFLALVPALVTVVALRAAVAHAEGTGVAARRLPIRPAHGRPFVPAIGDWEGSINGFPSSFELVYKPAFQIFRRAPYGFEDLTTIEPSSCPVSGSLYSEGVIGQQPDITPLGLGGAFPPGYSVSGAIRAAGVASLSAAFNTDPETGNPLCRGTLRWTLHPASRHPVDDGSWTLRFANGESETLSVTGGGRLATGFSFPLALYQCGGPAGGVDLFVQASGDAVYSEPASGLTVRLSFAAAKTASGEITANTIGCGSYTLAMTAALEKSAA